MAAFEAAYEQDSLPKYLYNLALAYQKLKDFEKAIDYVEKYQDEAEDAKGLEHAETMHSLLMIKLKNAKGQVAIVSTPEESLARFKMDDESVASGITPFKAWVPHGTYQLEVRKVGYDTFKKVVTVRGDKRLFLRVELKKQRTKPKPKPMAAGQRKKIEKPLNLGPKWLPWAVLGGGGVLLAGGVTMAALSNQELSDRDDLIKKAKRDGNEVTLPQLKEHDDAAKAHALTANVLISVGVVAALAGGTLWFLGRRTGPTVAVMPTDGGIGLSVGGPL